jgi:hypothetical protein
MVWTAGFRTAVISPYEQIQPDSGHWEVGW